MTKYVETFEEEQLKIDILKYSKIDLYPSFLSSNSHKEITKVKSFFNSLFN